MNRSARVLLLVAIVCGPLLGCRPDLGECDEARARTVVYTDDVNGWPAYEGQALVESSCGGRSQQCHSSEASGGTRLGAPAGVDFDLTVLNASTANAGTDALARGQREVFRLRYDVMRQLENGTMPPGRAGAEFVAAHADYLGLPSVDSAAGRDIVRNWLACGAPVVERTEPLPSGPTTVGAVVAASPCPDPATDACGGDTCIDTASDPTNCGGCGNTCVADPRTCSAGLCDCPVGAERDASGDCHDLMSDPANCGEFGHVCAPGVGCVAGLCECGDPSLTACADGCLDTTSDPLNCSSCGLSCPPSATCAGSTCVCSAGLASCISGCVDTLSDVNNCGMCEHACGPGEVCAGGTCLVGGCPGSTTDCSSSCVDLASNDANCGACGNACLIAGTSCIGSACSCPPQSPVLTLCTNGCYDVTSSATNCGACGNVCPTGTVCSGASCVCSVAGTSLCASGCVHLTSDSQNCGACGRLCPTGAGCSGGTCACSTPGLTACGDACIDLGTSATNCGMCGHACPTGQACSAGVCRGISFAADVLPIFTGQCTASGCHTGRRPAGDLALDASTAWLGLLGSLGTGAPSTQCTSPSRLRVAPGSPDGSYLVDKLLGINLCQGNQMPKVGTYLPQADIDVIRAWIEAGAPND